MNKVVFIGLAAFCGALLCGCTSSPGPYLPPNTTKYSVESTDKFVLLDKYSQSAVTCTGLGQRITPENLVEVTANVKNRDAHKIQIQVCCVFQKENAPTPTPGVDVPVDQTSWLTVALDEGATETVRFTSPKVEDRAYSIQVRQGR